MSRSISFLVLVVWHMNRFNEAQTYDNGVRDLGTSCTMSAQCFRTDGLAKCIAGRCYSIPVTCSNGGKAISNSCGGLSCASLNYGPVMCIDDVCCQVVGQCPANKIAIADLCDSVQDCMQHTRGEVECINNVCCIPSPTPKPNDLCANGGQKMRKKCTEHIDCNTTPPVFEEYIMCVDGECCDLPEMCPNGGRQVGAPCDNAEQCNSHFPASWECLHHMCCLPPG